MARMQRSKAAAKEISRRLLHALQKDLGLTLSEASEALGYATSATLHAVKNARSLPDATRLAKFASHQIDATGRTINLHWLLTGQGDKFFVAEQRPANNLDVDIMNSTMRLDTAAKEALLVLLRSR